MTLEELETSLPHGFRDATISEFSRDFRTGTVRMKLELLLGICKGAPADASPFRPGELTFQDVVYCTIEAPDPESAYKHRGDISFRFARTEPGEVPAHLLEATCQQFLCYSIFVLDWWAHIHIAARDVSLTWADCRDRI